VSRSPKHTLSKASADNFLGLAVGTRLHLVGSAVVEVTGLGNPCAAPNKIQKGLMAATLDRDDEGNLVCKAGIVGVVLASGEVRPGDPIRVEPPPPPHRPLAPVCTNERRAVLGERRFPAPSLASRRAMGQALARPEQFLSRATVTAAMNLGIICGMWRMALICGKHS
jgi:hypothetical protein